LSRAWFASLKVMHPFFETPYPFMPALNPSYSPLSLGLSSWPPVRLPRRSLGTHVCSCCLATFQQYSTNLGEILNNVQNKGVGTQTAEDNHLGSNQVQMTRAEKCWKWCCNSHTATRAFILKLFLIFMFSYFGAQVFILNLFGTTPSILNSIRTIPQFGRILLEGRLWLNINVTTIAVALQNISPGNFQNP
jgi:hypothetical protein